MPRDGSAPLLRWEDVWQQYQPGPWTVGGVSLDVQPGQLLGIIGPNGAGKSTLLRMAAGVLVPQRGRITVNGRELGSFSRRELARIAGYLPQSVASEYDYRVEDVVAMGRYPHLTGVGFLAANDEDVISRCLDRTGVAPFRGRRLSRLSGGERQRVYLASVLAQEPALLLLDEPTAALDVHYQIQFFDILRELAGQGIGVVVVTHDLNLAACYCDRLALLQQGTVAALGPPSEVLRPDRLDPVYGPRLRVIVHPSTGGPAVLPDPPVSRSPRSA